MNQKQFVSHFYKKLKNKAKTDKNKQRAYALEVTEIFFKSVSDSLKIGDKVTINGFGTFQAKKYNFHNKKIAPTRGSDNKKFPVFKMSKVLGRKLNSGSYL